MDFILSLGFFAAFGMFGALVYYVMDMGKSLREISDSLSKIAKHLEQIDNEDEVDK